VKVSHPVVELKKAYKAVYELLRSRAISNVTRRQLKLFLVQLDQEINDANSNKPADPDTNIAAD